MSAPSLAKFGRVHDFFEAVVRTCIVPFGPALVVQFLRKDPGGDVSQSPLWWALVVVAFTSGRTFGSVFHKATSGQPPLASSNRASLVLFAALVLVVFSTGFVATLRQLLTLRFFTGLLIQVVWHRYVALMIHCKEPSTPRSSTTSDPSVINPLYCFGVMAGCVTGGVLYADNNLSYPAIKPSFAVALLMAAPLAVSVSIHMASKKPSRSYRPGYSPLDSSDPIRGTLGMGSHLTSSSSSISSSSLGSSPTRRDTTTTTSLTGTAVPQCFVLACKGDVERARARYRDTLSWRAANRVDTILAEPQPHFRVIKEYYPHFLHGRSLKGELVCYEYPGKMDLSRLKREGVGPKELARHYTFMQEAMWARLDAREEARVMTVLDIGGFSITSLNKDVLDVMAATSEVMQNHYPERVTRIVVVNVPYFLGSAWSVVASVLPKAVQDRIVISKSPLDDLKKHISMDQIPTSYGGQSPHELGQSEEELYMSTLVRENAQRQSSSSSPAAEPTYPSPPRASAAASTRRLADPVVRQQQQQQSSGSSSGTSGISSSRKERGSPWPLSWINPFKSRAKKAYLGYENRYVYDKVNQMWVLEDEMMSGGSASGSVDLERDRLPSNPPDPMSRASSLSSVHGRGTPTILRQEETMEDPALVEEHGLVLAIQAAHWHQQRLKLEQQLHQQHSPRMGSAGVMRSAGWTGRPGNYPPGHSPTFDFNSPRRPPSYLIIQMVFLYSAWCAMQAAIEAMVPVWMLGSPHQGGLGAHPLGVGITLATVATIFVLLKGLGRHTRLMHLPSRSPLRAFRLGAGLLVATICGMSYHPASLEAPLFVRCVTQAFHTVMLTLLVGSLVMARHASAALLYMVLKNTCTHPQYISNITATLGDLPGPLIGALIYMWSTEAKLSYPMDTRLLFNVCALLSLGLYVLSLLLHVNVWGDFGISGEEGELSSRSGRSSDGTSTCRLLEDLFEVPVKDLSSLIDDTLRPSRRWSMPHHRKPG